MSEQAFIYKTNGEIIPIMPKKSNEFTLEELQQIVDGHIELVYLSDGRIMIINEEGKLNGFEYNAEATKLFDSSKGDYIVGNVVVMPSKYLS